MAHVEKSENEEVKVSSQSRERLHEHLRPEQVPKDIEIKELGATSQIVQVQGQCGRRVDNKDLGKGPKEILRT